MELYRSLEEWAKNPDVKENLSREFPHLLPTFEEFSQMDRRQFIKLFSATLALAGATACTQQPLEKIIPFIKDPEKSVPGKAKFYASGLMMRGFVSSVLVESNMGRPTKVEGNPEHPGSRGKTDVFAQAKILDLYDPFRSQAVRYLGKVNAWNRFREELKKTLQMEKPLQGKGIRLVTGAVSSPLILQQIKDFLGLYPKAKWLPYEAVSFEEIFRATEQTFGQRLWPQLALNKATVVFSCEHDFLFGDPAKVKNIADFTAARKPGKNMLRLYVAESSPTVTGSMADERVPIRSAQAIHVLGYLAKILGMSAEHVPANLTLRPEAMDVLDHVAEDLKANRGRGLVTVGEHFSAPVHALAYRINAFLGNLGETLSFIENPFPNQSNFDRNLESLMKDMAAGEVTSLFIVGKNPAYDAIGEIDFAAAVKKVPLCVHAGMYVDETADLAHWHVPLAHELEYWGDGRSVDGTITLVQPLIKPLYDGKSPSELMAFLLGSDETRSFQLLKNFWKKQYAGLTFEKYWAQSVHDGFFENSQGKKINPKFSGKVVLPDAKMGEGFELTFRPDPHVFDGEFSGNTWLQECPKPLTKLTWDNALLVSPQDAKRIGLEVGQVVNVHLKDKFISAPVWILPGQMEGVFTAHMGYGRRTGEIAAHAGFATNTLRHFNQMWMVSDVTVEKTSKKVVLASTQIHHGMEGRDLIRRLPVQEFLQESHGEGHPGDEKAPHHEENLSLYPERKKEGNQWGMVIDLSSCVGCNACVVACQAENNIPTVGKDQVAIGREMHWIRIDRYYEGPLENPKTYHQPLPCMHCENAPCEPVCPAAATVHSAEGLNDMVYNRCVGTRYCANNCPYKVRRFNFLEFNGDKSETMKMLHNPNVTVRSRGVMEKCSYCVQRINEVRIEAKKEGRPIKDGEVVTACQQVCPASAITFGNLADPNSEVSKKKGMKHHFSLLTELNTRPRTTYLAKVENPKG